MSPHTRRLAWGTAAALASPALGGVAAAVTRSLAGAADPLTIGAFRYSIAVVVLLPLAFLRHDRWPRRADWPGVAAIGLVLFGVFPVLFNTALIFTSAARGALALSSVPLLTLLGAALLRVERLTLRKATGVAVAMGGVGAGLLSGLGAAPPGAWQGDLLMLAGALCLALTNIWSPRYLRRTPVTTFTVAGMAVGAVVLTLLAAWHGGFAAVPAFGAPQWAAIAYLGVPGGALCFFLWAWALERTTPTLVGVTIASNPVAAALAGAVLLDEPLQIGQILGVGTLVLGTWLTATSPRRGGRVSA